MEKRIRSFNNKIESRDSRAKAREDRSYKANGERYHERMKYLEKLLFDLNEWITTTKRVYLLIPSSP